MPFSKKLMCHSKKHKMHLQLGQRKGDWNNQLWKRWLLRTSPILSYFIINFREYQSTDFCSLSKIHKDWFSNFITSLQYFVLLCLFMCFYALLSVINTVAILGYDYYLMSITSELQVSSGVKPMRKLSQGSLKDARV